ncbi:MAG: SDR family NAD(P)-dependent oxidoreductase, partial [Oricola sp.]|nr:SDR family NAD(P)-dependent oxidoreductase [Oricola sp.]
MALDGKIAIVTGGAQGIGYAIAKRLLQDNVRVAIADVDERKGQAAEKDLATLGDVRFIATDVGDRLSVHNLMASTLDVFGDIDILVNNAGIQHVAAIEDFPADTWDRIIAIN